MDLKEEEAKGIEDINAEGEECITKLPEYIHLREGKEKVTKDLDAKKFTISTTLLPKKVPFEGSLLARSHC